MTCIMHVYDSIMYACIVMWVMWASIVGRPILIELYELDLITSNYNVIHGLVLASFPLSDSLWPAQSFFEYQVSSHFSFSSQMPQ